MSLIVPKIRIPVRKFAPSDRKYIYHVLLYVVVIPVKVIEETSLSLF